MTDSDSDSVSRFTDLYKNKSRKEEQQSERRRTLLEEQKLFRQSELDAGRPGLLELIEAEQSTDSDCSDAVHRQRRPRIWYSKLYRDKAQLSEWMYERPDDLDCWYMVPCPAGTRCLVVIRKGLAMAYDKEGRSITRFTTALGKRQRVTVLDCFLVKNNRTFYALDMLVYNEMDLVHCDCQFRFLWLRSKMEEDDLQNKFCTLKQSPYQLNLLPAFDFKNPSEIVDALSRYPMFPNPETKLDGLLFYHKESNYIYGKTPLVTWLFPFMVPDVLGEEWRQSLNSNYLSKTPADYPRQNPRAFMDEFDAKLAKRRAKRNNSLLTGMDEDGEEYGGSSGGTGEFGPGPEGLDGSYEDEDWQRKEVDEMRRLEMEG